jgi:ABC-type cobalt transport system substrate-binding protein
MPQFWWGVFVDALFDSLKFVGKEPSDILFSVLVFISVGALLIARIGWPKGIKETREKLPKVIGKDIVIVLALFFLIVIFHVSKGAYGRWKEADDRAYNLSASIKASQPDFRPAVRTEWIAPAGDPGNAIVGVYSRVVNLGAEGSVTDFWIDVKFDDGRVLHSQIAADTASGKFVNLGKNAQGNNISLPDSDYWLRKTSELIRKNGSLQGFLMALVIGTTPEEIRSKKATIVFTCGDATGKKSSTENRWGDGDTTSPIGIVGLQKPIPTTKRR